MFSLKKFNCNREKPNDEEWLVLNRLKIPLLLNFAQCKLLEKEYYAVIEHCTTVLKSDPGAFHKSFALMMLYTYGPSQKFGSIIIFDITKISKLSTI